MRLKIAVLPGDGIGPEVVNAAVRALRTLAEIGGFEFQFREFPIGGAALAETGFPLPKATLDACLESDAVLLGAVGSPKFDDLPRDRRPEAGLLQLRIALGGYANLRPAIAYNALTECSPLRATIVAGANVLFVRELLGGLYFGEPRAIDAASHSAWNTMRYSESEIERVARVAFEQAKLRGGKVTSVDKANVLETSQLWRSVVTRISKEYPAVALDHMYVDAFAMHLVTNPKRFDVVLTENLFGDILSDEAAAITGSLGMLPSATIGGAVNLYEPVHGSAPDLAGRNLANPLGAIASAAMMLRHTAAMYREADEIESAIRGVLAQGYRTADIHRSPGEQQVSTTEMGALVEEALTAAVIRRQAYHAV
ncbi:MAG: 3-isopropylmalate dehydrogenase [Acidobacteria bacterium]|nr:3-isopropylmalate dehydrogenase [Acidobacteriota bacterium]